MIKYFTKKELSRRGDLKLWLFMDIVALILTPSVAMFICFSFYKEYGFGFQLALGALAIGLLILLYIVYALRHPQDTFVIDDLNDSITQYSDGKEVKSISFENAEQILIKLHEQYSIPGPNETKTPIYFHQVRIKGFGENVTFFESTDIIEARKVAEELAGKFKVGILGDSKENRNVNELDKAYFIVYKNDAEKTARLDPPKNSRLEVNEDFDRSSIVFLDRNYNIFIIGLVALFTGAIFSMMILMAGAPVHEFSFEKISITRVVLGFSPLLIGASILALGLKIALKKTEIIITPQQVIYGNTAIAMEKIEEINKAEGTGLPRLIGDNQTLEIYDWLYNKKDYDYLLHELRRLVILMGKRL